MQMATNQRIYGCVAVYMRASVCVFYVSGCVCVCMGVWACVYVDVCVSVRIHATPDNSSLV